MNSRKWLLAVCASGLLATGIAACGDNEEDGGGGGGGISIDGSSTVQPFAEAAAELFNDQNSDVNVSVAGSGTGGGFEKFCGDETDISTASRPIDEKEEVPVCEKAGVEYTELQVANDGIAIVTNPAVEISCLTTDQLARLWSDETVTSFSDLGEDAETGEPLPDVDVSLYGPGTDSGTFEFFTEEINGEEGKSRADYQASEDDNQLVTGVSGDQGGLAYFGFSYYEQNADALNLVSVDSGDGCVEPSAETIQGGDYAPLSRPLFMYPSNARLAEAATAQFVQYVVDNNQAIAEAALIVPMNETQAGEASTTLKGALG